MFSVLDCFPCGIENGMKYRYVVSKIDIPAFYSITSRVKDFGD